jgi:hypothetical protein
LKQVINTTRKHAKEKERAATLKLEMDYELATLFEAMENSNEEKIMECKIKLDTIRLELMSLNAF